MNKYVMEFRNWLLTEKYMTNSSAYCGECKQPLYAINVAFNPTERAVGQLRVCHCHKSQVWTNRIRNINTFLAFLGGHSKKYTNGFCNDVYCAYCWSWPTSIHPKRNGVSGKIFGLKYDIDLYGCEHCGHNQEIYMDTGQEGKELDTQSIIDWYKRHVLDLKQIVMKHNPFNTIGRVNQNVATNNPNKQKVDLNP